MHLSILGRFCKLHCRERGLEICDLLLTPPLIENASGKELSKRKSAAKTIQEHLFKYVDTGPQQKPSRDNLCTIKTKRKPHYFRKPLNSFKYDNQQMKTERGQREKQCRLLTCTHLSNDSEGNLRIGRASNLIHNLCLPIKIDRFRKRYINACLYHLASFTHKTNSF